MEVLTKKLLGIGNFTYLSPQNRVNSSWKIKEESSHPWGHARKSWTPPPPSRTSSFPWLKSETKTLNLGLTLPPLSWNKTRSTKDASSGYNKQDFLPHTTTNHPPTIKTLQTTIIKKLGLLFVPQWFLKQGLQYQNWKANTYSPLPRNSLGTL